MLISNRGSQIVMSYSDKMAITKNKDKTWITKAY